MSQNKSLVGTIIKLVVVIFIVVIIAKLVMDSRKVTDITNMVNMEKAQLEEELKVSMIDTPSMVNKIYHYTRGQVTVDRDGDNGIAVVYADGEQVGVHIDKKKYSMYGLRVGDSVPNISSKMTYEYDQDFEVLEDLFQGHSTATFYRNSKKGDCLVLIVNDTSNKIVAITYYSAGFKMTELLSGV